MRKRLVTLCLLTLFAPKPVAAVEPCPAVPYEGTCDGSTARWCEGDQAHELDCEAQGLCCGWVMTGPTGYYGCQECGGCASACTEGQTGCSVEARHSFVCVDDAEAGCGQRSYERCDEGQVCTDGECGAPAEPGSGGVTCPATCTLGDVGCADDTTRFLCQAPKPGACPVQVMTECGDGEACFGGACQPVVGSEAAAAPDDGGCGAAPGQSAALLASLLGLLFGLSALRAGRRGAR